jgi:hypothetical protein
LFLLICSDPARKNPPNPNNVNNNSNSSSNNNAPIIPDLNIGNARPKFGHAQTSPFQNNNMNQKNNNNSFVPRDPPNPNQSPRNVNNNNQQAPRGNNNVNNNQQQPRDATSPRGFVPDMRGYNSNPPQRAQESTSPLASPRARFVSNNDAMNRHPNNNNNQSNNSNNSNNLPNYNNQQQQQQQQSPQQQSPQQPIRAQLQYSLSNPSVNNTQRPQNNNNKNNFQKQPSNPNNDMNDNTPPETWDKFRVQKWLRDIDFHEFGPNLKYTDGSALLALGRQDLMDMGIPSQAAIPLSTQIENLKLKRNFGGGRF